MRFAEAQQHGLSEEIVEQLSHPERSNLPEREKQALLFAELYLTSPESITDGFFEDMKEHFTEGELVEMMFFVGFYNILQKFNSAIDLEPIDGTNIVVDHLTDHGINVS